MGSSHCPHRECNAVDSNARQSLADAGLASAGDPPSISEVPPGKQVYHSALCAPPTFLADYLKNKRMRNTVCYRDSQQLNPAVSEFLERSCERQDRTARKQELETPCGSPEDLAVKKHLAAVFCTPTEMTRSEPTTPSDLLCAPPNFLAKHLHNNRQGASLRKVASLKISWEGPDIAPLPYEELIAKPVIMQPAPPEVSCVLRHLKHWTACDTPHETCQWEEQHTSYTHGISCKGSLESDDEGPTDRASSVAGSESLSTSSEEALPVASNAIRVDGTSDPAILLADNSRSSLTHVDVRETEFQRLRAAVSGLSRFSVQISTLGGGETSINGLHPLLGVDTLCEKVSVAFNIPDFAVRLLHDGDLYTSLSTDSLGAVGLNENSEILLVQQWGWAKPDLNLLTEFQRKWGGQN